MYRYLQAISLKTIASANIERFRVEPQQVFAHSFSLRFSSCVRKRRKRYTSEQPGVCSSSVLLRDTCSSFSIPNVGAFRTTSEAPLVWRFVSVIFFGSFFCGFRRRLLCWPFRDVENYVIFVAHLLVCGLL
jgi:hypothetical protein